MLAYGVGSLLRHDEQYCTRLSPLEDGLKLALSVRMTWYSLKIVVLVGCKES